MAAVSKTKHHAIAVDHHQLAHQLVAGHQAIAAAVAEYAADKQRRLEDARALYGAQGAAEAIAPPVG